MISLPFQWIHLEQNIQFEILQRHVLAEDTSSHAYDLWRHMRGLRLHMYPSDHSHPSVVRLWLAIYCRQTLLSTDSKSGPADVSQNYTVGMSATCEMLTACFVARFGAKPWTISSPGVIRIQSQSWLSHGCSSAIYPQESNTSAAVVTLLWIQPPSKGPPSGLQRDLTPQRNNLQSS